jgi:hypothetical protein
MIIIDNQLLVFEQRMYVLKNQIKQVNEHVDVANKTISDQVTAVKSNITQAAEQQKLKMQHSPVQPHKM